MRTITGRFFAALAVGSAVRMLVSTEAMAQQVRRRVHRSPPLPRGKRQRPHCRGELQKVTVTGYIIPRVGDGPQPVTTLIRFITEQADQTVSDVIGRLPKASAPLIQSPRLETAFRLVRPPLV